MDTMQGFESAFDPSSLELGLQELETLEAPAGFWTWAGRVAASVVVVASAAASYTVGASIIT